MRIQIKLTDKARRILNIQEGYTPRKRHPQEALPPQSGWKDRPQYVPNRDNHYGRVVSL